MSNRGPQSTNGRGNHRRPAGLRLGGHQAERLVVGRDNGDVGGAIPMSEFSLVDRRRKLHDVTDAECGRQLLEMFRVRQPATARPTNDRDYESLTKRPDRG